MQVLFLCLFLSLPTTLAFLVTTMPILSNLDWQRILDEAELIFPPGIELILNDSKLDLRHYVDPTTAAVPVVAKGDSGEKRQTIFAGRKRTGAGVRRHRS